MARQNVGKPRFFIDLIQYWDAKGIIAGIGPYASYGYYAGNTGGQADTTGESPNGYYPDWVEDVAPPGSSFGNNKGYQPELIGFTPHTYYKRPLYPTGSTDASTAYFPNSLLLKERCQLPKTEKYFMSALNHNFNETKVDRCNFTFAKSFAPWQDRYTDLPPGASWWSSSYNYLANTATNNRRGVVNASISAGPDLLNGWSLWEISNTSQFTDEVNKRTAEPQNSQWAYGDWLGDALPSGYTWDDAGLGFDLGFFGFSTNMNRGDYFAQDNGGRTDWIQGTFNFGPIFEMDRSPDLKLTMTREYDGIKSQETKSGHTLIDIKHDGPPPWRSNMPSWGLHKNNNKSDWRWLYKNAPSRGRRTWDLEFSYLDDTDMMARNESLTTYSPTDAGDFLDGKITGYTADDFETINEGDGDEQHFVSNSQTGSDFFSVVIEKTMGGSLPFMFQPDGNNDSPDQFAICVMERNSFKIKQVAHNVYSIKLKIREIW